MSRVLDNAFEEVKKTHLTFIDKQNIEIEEAYIFWTNFRGEANRFGQAARNFNVAIPEEAVEELINLGYRVREDVVSTVTDNEGNPAKVHFINVKVNMASDYPPVIKLFSEYKGRKTQRVLDIDTVGELDRMQFQRVDIRIHSYISPNYPGKCTGYLNTLHCVQEPNVVFSGFYDDWNELDTPEDGSETPINAVPVDDKY